MAQPDRAQSMFGGPLPDDWVHHFGGGNACRVCGIDKNKALMEELDECPGFRLDWSSQEEIDQAIDVGKFRQSLYDFMKTTREIVDDALAPSVRTDNDKQKRIANIRNQVTAIINTIDSYRSDLESMLKRAEQAESMYKSINDNTFDGMFK